MTKQYKKASDRHGELKHLLSLELSVKEIADKMEVTTGYVYKIINDRGWQQFIQPGKRKKEWRTKCEQNKLIIGEEKVKESVTLIESYTNALHQELISQGFLVELEDVRGMVDECFTKCLKTYDDSKGAAFKTYLYSALRKSIVSYKTQLARSLKRQGYTEICKPTNDAKAA